MKYLCLIGGLFMLLAWEMHPTAVHSAPSSVLAKPDLIVTRFRILSINSREVNYAYTVQNIGRVPALLNNITVQVFYYPAEQQLKTQPGIPGGNTILRSGSGDLLLPGKTISGSFSFSGDFTRYKKAKIVVDTYNMLDETLENNNFKKISVPGH